MNFDKDALLFVEGYAGKHSFQVNDSIVFGQLSFAGTSIRRTSRSFAFGVWFFHGAGGTLEAKQVALAAIHT